MEVTLLWFPSVEFFSYKVAILVSQIFWNGASLWLSWEISPVTVDSWTCHFEQHNKLPIFCSIYLVYCFCSSLCLLHYLLMPLQRDERIEQSVARMMTIIDLARNIRERHNKPLKTPLRCVGDTTLSVI